MRTLASSPMPPGQAARGGVTFARLAQHFCQHAERGARALSALTLAALLASSVSACGSSSSGGTPSGPYTATFTDLARPLNGSWTVTFAKDGSYTVTSNPEGGLSIGKGSHYAGTTFVIKTIYPGACGPVGGGVGIYKLSLSGDKLRFVRVTDHCTLRAQVLGHTFTKQ